MPRIFFIREVKYDLNFNGLNLRNQNWEMVVAVFYIIQLLYKNVSYTTIF